MVEEEVDHLAGVGEDSETAEELGVSGVPPESVEAGEEAAGAKGFAA